MIKSILLFILLINFSVILSQSAGLQEEHYQALTPEEQQLLEEMIRDFEETDPPPGNIRNIAEFEPMQGVLIRYPFGIPYNLIAEMSQEIVVTTIVSGLSQENSVLNIYNNNGVNTENCNFIYAPSDSYWTRDYGPWYVIDGNGEFGIVNFRYNRPRPNDNDIPIEMADFLDINLFGMDVEITGGNFMTDGMGLASSSSLVYKENPRGFESGEFHEIWDFLGNSNWGITSIQSYDGTYCAKSGNIEDNQYSSISIQLDIKKDNYNEYIRFYKKVSCENDIDNNADYLVFYIDGNEIERWDGDSEWSLESYDIASYSSPYYISDGTHTFEWKYIKNGDTTEGEDCAWIDNIIIPTKDNSFPSEIVHQRVQQYLGIGDYLVLTDPLGDYIEHIDCWGKFLAVDKVLIGEVLGSDPRYEDYEAIADYFATTNCSYGYPYEVFRVYEPNGQPYTNSLILNDRVFVPITGSSWDDDALAVYESAMPGYEVLGFTGSWESTDALHCRAKGIADLGMLYIGHIPDPGAIAEGSVCEIETSIIPYSGEAVITDSLKVIYRVNGGSWNYSPLYLQAEHDYTGQIPAQQEGNLVEYYIHAADSSGRSAEHPYTGRYDPHNFVIGPYVSQLEIEPDSIEVRINPDSVKTSWLKITNSGSTVVDYLIEIEALQN